MRALQFLTQLLAFSLFPFLSYAQEIDEEAASATKAMPLTAQAQTPFQNPQQIPAKLTSKELVDIEQIEAVTAPLKTKFSLPIEVKIAPGAAIYAQNPGDIGNGAVIQWQVPRGIELGTLHWPLPKLQLKGTQATFIYDEPLTLHQDFYLQENFAEGIAILSLDWFASNANDSGKSVASFQIQGKKEAKALDFKPTILPLPEKSGSGWKKNIFFISIPYPHELERVENAFFIPDQPHVIAGKEMTPAIVLTEQGYAYHFAWLKPLEKALSGLLVIEGPSAQEEKEKAPQAKRLKAIAYKVELPATDKELKPVP